MARKTKDPLLTGEENKKVADLEKYMTAPRPERRIADKKAAVTSKSQPGRSAKMTTSLRSALFSKKNIWRAILILVFAAAMGASGYFYWQYKKVTTANNEAAGYVSKISKYMLLPTDEVPTLATVADAGKLSAQPFFAQAQNGDKVLFFTKAQKAILYRPSNNLIVEAVSMAGAAPTAAAPASQNTLNAPSTSDASQAQNEPQTEAQPSQEAQNQEQNAAEAPKTATVAIYNGTATKGLAKNIQGALGSISEAQVISTGNSQGNFEKTIIVDLSGSSQAAAQKIAEALGASIASLPEGEAKPEADILIIGGADYKMK